MRAQELSTDEDVCADLPGVLFEIAEATSYEIAMKLAAAVGGTRVYIPARPAAEHWLCKIVSHQDALAIGAALAPRGLDIIIPMGRYSSRPSRWRRMKALIDTKLPKREIARAVSVHERTVQRHINQKTRIVADAISQADLFD